MVIDRNRLKKNILDLSYVVLYGKLDEKTKEICKESIKCMKSYYQSYWRYFHIAKREWSEVDECLLCGDCGGGGHRI